jgi:transposase-like protein
LAEKDFPRSAAAPRYRAEPSPTDLPARYCNNEAPEKITLDRYEATHRAVAELKAERVLPAQIEVWTNKYLNNLIEQDHRRIKQRYYPLLGFKKFGNSVAEYQQDQ